MKPIIKYRGGKSKEIPLYLKYIPQFNTYFEPFFGGGATYFYLEPENAVINDINKPLIDFYRSIASNDFFQIKNELNSLDIQYKKNREIFKKRKIDSPDDKVHDPNDDLYYKIRDMFNRKIEPSYNIATLYYFINKTAYSGMIRYNSKGEFNVPYGRYANFNTQLLTLEHHHLLKDAKILNTSYEKVFDLSTNKDFIFLDPPYDTTFSDYGNEMFTGDFGEDEHRRLASDFKNLTTPTLMIIGETNLTRELYSKYIKDIYKKNYSVNIRNRFSSKSNHLIITNY